MYYSKVDLVIYLILTFLLMALDFVHTHLRYYHILNTLRSFTICNTCHFNQDYSIGYIIIKKNQYY